MPTLPNMTLIQPMSEEEGIQKLSSSPAKALKDLYDSAIPIPSKPQDYDGNVPRSLKNMSEEDLGDLLNKQSEWAAWIHFELAKAEAYREAARGEMDFLRAKIRLSLKRDETGAKLTVKDKDDWVEADPRVVDAVFRHDYWNSMYRLTRAIAERAQRDWDTISRRITLRGQSIDRVVRGHNVANIPVPNPAVRRRPGVSAPPAAGGWPT